MRHKSFPAFLFAVLTVASCSLEEAAVVSDGGHKTDATTISTTTEDQCDGQDESTKAKLSSKYEVTWESGDKITVVGSSAATFTLSAGVGTKRGEFSGDISAAGEGPYFAVMPADASATVTSEGVTFTIPQKKGAQNNNIASSLNPMAGKVNGSFVGFRNLFGLLRITLTSNAAVTVKKIALHDLGGNMLWGKCFIPIKADTLDYNNITLSGGNNTINMVWSGSRSVTTGNQTVLYFAVPPGALDRGFSLVVYEKDESASDGIGKAWTFTESTSLSNAAERNVICALTVPKLTEKSEKLDVKSRGYYKTLFVNAGCRLSNYYRTSDFKWLTTLGLANDYEYFAGDSVTSVIATQASVINKNSDDDNGVLLYPDGEPRFRMVYCNGGKSSYHGRTLYQDGRQRFHDFYFNGGSYVGTCAGGFLARKFHNGINVFDNSDTTQNHGFGIWPGTMNSSALPISNSLYPSIYTAQKMLSSFGPFAEGDTIEQVRHHGGFYIARSATNNAIPHENLMSYQYTEKDTSTQTSYTEYNRVNWAGFGGRVSRVNYVSMIAYKKSETSGRAVLCGSHPERETSGKKLQLMETMVSYALEGIGNIDVKAALTLGKTYTASVGVGDRQYHHFTLTTAADLKEFSLKLASSTSADLYLTMRKGDFAWMSDADYVLTTEGGNKCFNIKNLPAGTWYIGVYCPTTVTTTAKTGSNNLAYIQYSGNTFVLNGVPYTLTASTL